jgi:diadenosine tetraphosphate (Ap4A) HIT family hydrolase
MAKYEPTTKDNKCVFCEIVKRNIPCSSFWEDEKHIAFLSIDPNTEGVSVVIPKKHYDSNPLTTPNKILSGLIIASKKTAQILENYFEDTGRIGFIIEGTGINHLHIKLYPMHKTSEWKNGGWKQFLSNQKDNPWYEKYEGYLSSAGGVMSDPVKLTELAEKIKSSIK